MIPRFVRAFYLTRSTFALVPLLVATASLPVAAVDLRAGAAVVDVSPRKLPAIRNGMFLQSLFNRVLDPLHARALVLDDGSTRLAIVIVDSCMMPLDVCDAAKEIAARKTGIPMDRMLVAATHTHNAPSVMDYCLGADKDADYAAYLPGKIAEAIEAAFRNLEPARLGWSSVSAPEHTHCRRWITRPDKQQTDPFGEKNVRAMMHPGYENPNYIGPAGPVDDQLSVLSVQARDGRPVAVLANFSMHYFGSGAGFSADYFGHFCANLEKQFGKPGSSNAFVALMSQGTSGDLHWMDYSRARRTVGVEDYARQLAELAVGAIARIQHREDISLAMAETKLSLNWRLPDAARLKWAREVVAKIPAGKPPRDRTEIYARLAIYLHENPREELKLQALRIGELGITAMPNEVYGITGLKLKAQSPLPATFNIELANGASGYIPPPEQHALGGYTTWPARTAGLEVRAEPKIVGTLLTLLEKISDRPRRPPEESNGDYAHAVLKHKPMACWRMGELGGAQLADSSGNNIVATLSPGFALGLPGPQSPALSGNTTNRVVHFAGGHAHARLTRAPRDYSVAAWFWNGLPAEVREVTGGIISLDGEDLQIGGTSSPGETGKLVFAVGKQRWIGGRSLVAKSWHHMTVVREAGTVRVYLDGNRVPEIEAKDIARTPGDGGVLIGADSAKQFPLEGRVDEVAIFDHALPAADVTALHAAAGLKPPPIVRVPPGMHRPTGTSDLERVSKVVLASQPRAYWPLHATRDGVTPDRSGNSHHARWETNAGHWLPGSDALNFTGGRLHADVGSLGDTCSVEFWFWNKLPNDSRSVTGYLFSRGAAVAHGGPGESVALGGTYAKAGRLLVFNGNRANEVLTGRTVIPPRSWNHVAFVRDGKRVAVYLNGESQPEIAGEIAITYPPGKGEFFFGGRNDNFSNFHGRLDEVAIYDRALKPEEIAAHFAAAGVTVANTPEKVSAPDIPRPLSPQETLQSIRVRDGYAVELVAAEPLVKDPVAIDWGPDGRLWVIEMADYPLGLDGQGKPGGRVRVLADTNGDGRYDESKVFADGLPFPTGLLVWRTGVLVTAAPDILYLEDRDGDGRAEVREKWFTGFFEGNQQLRVNGLRWGLDNRVYCASGSHQSKYGAATKIRSPRSGREFVLGSRDFRLQPDEGVLEPVSGPSQFGRDRNDWGDWFGVQNSYPLWHYVLEEPALARNTAVTYGDPRRVLTERNPKVHPASELEKRYHSFDQSGRFTSACAPTIYRDELLFPADPVQHAFTCEPFHNLVQHLVLREAGVSFTAGRDPADGPTDFFASTDRWCRPVMTRTGPDGALWVVDMYRHMIEHPQWLPAAGKAELEPYYRFGEEHGRIYRVVSKSSPNRVNRREHADPQPAGKNPPHHPGEHTTVFGESPIKALESPNGIVRDLAQRVLVWNGDPSVVSALEQLARDSSRATTRLQALCTLDGLGSLKSALVESALRDSSPGVRRNALRLAGPWLDQDASLLPKVLALTEDPDPKVRLQLVLSLGQCSRPEAGVTLARLAQRGGSDAHLRDAVLSSASPHFDTLTTALLESNSAPVALLDGLFSMGMQRNAGLGRLLEPLLKPVANGPSIAQMESLARWLDLLARNRKSLSALAKHDPELSALLPSLRELFVTTATLAGDERSPVPRRVAAIGLLGRESTTQGQALERLRGLTGARMPEAVRQASLQAIARVAGPQAPELMLAGWPGYLPETRQLVADLLLAREDGARVLVKALSAQRVSPNDLDASRRQQLLRHRVPAIRAEAATALGRSAAPDRVAVVRSFQPALRLAGDGNRGRTVFDRLCLACHQPATGAPVGPDLRSITDRAPENLLTAILNPNDSVDPVYVAYTLELKDGTSLGGRMLGESGNGISLRQIDGREITVLRSDITLLQAGQLSLMPEGLEAGLSQQDMADLIAFVRELR